MRPGPLLATGFIAEVFEWDEGRVVKLYPDTTPRRQVERAHQVTRAAHAAGLPVPATYELVEIAGRPGIVFERIEGLSMRRYFQARPWKLLSSARQLAELHARVHGWLAPPEIPPLRQRLEERIDAATSLSEPQRQSARRCLGQLPAGDSLCHGDFHPDNILLSARGPIIIDWGSGTRGDSVADVAATSVLFDRAPLPPDLPFHLRVLVNVSRQALHSRYLNRYFQLRTGRRQDLERWRLFLCATLPGQEGSGQRSQCLERLERELDQAHSLPLAGS